MRTTEQLVISHLGRTGEGIAITPAGLLHVAGALPGETVQVVLDDRSHAGLIKIDNASPQRSVPICPHFGVCGGCAIQHLARASYRDWKRGLVIEALTQAGLKTQVDELIDAHGEGRRRATFHARRGTRAVLQVGFSARRAHRVVAIDRCPILAPALEGALAAAWAIAEVLGAAGKPLDIQATAAQEGLDVDVRGSSPWSPAVSAALAQVAERHRLARLTRHGVIVAQRAAPTVRMGRAAVRLPAGAFLQATAAGEAALAALAVEHCREAAMVADLFAGVGPFALRLAEGKRIVAADIDPEAIAALRAAGRGTARLKPIEAEIRDLYRRPFSAAELKRFDAVIFDPPRQGAEAQARALASSAVEVIVAISCNPGTFVRDARLLVDGGYRLLRVTPIDQFRYSSHVELVGLLRR